VRQARVVRKLFYVNGNADEDAEIAAAEARGWIGENTVIIRKFSLSAEEVAALNGC
jgi:hypothetical protein